MTPRMQKLVWISGPTRLGEKILKPPSGGYRRPEFRVYNYDGERFEAQCPRFWAERLQERGDVLIIDAPRAPKPAPVSKPDRPKKEVD